MKKIIITALALSVLAPMTQANADCGVGYGNAVDINVTTKVVTYSCVKLPEPPTREEIVQQSKVDLGQIITQKKNENPIEVINPDVVTVQPSYVEPIQRPTKVEVNATTGVTTVSDLNDDELIDYQNGQAEWEAKTTAQTQAIELAKTATGTKQCINWASGLVAGVECHIDPILASQEEIDYTWSIVEQWLSSWSFNLWSGW
tara:strand:- start:418 stop:1023 length:606 start_codon:yes stop_codon:yes gene_type:complete